MLSTPRWLALEVKYLDRALSFYQSYLDLDVRRETDSEAALAVGDTDLILRAPGDVPRGGLHTHYAMSIPGPSYDDWWDRLDERFDLVEHQFGDAKSLYFYDTEGNCVELGQSGDGGEGGDGGGTGTGDATDGDPAGVTGLFEIVLEVEDLPRAENFYERLGFEVTSRGDERKRVRLTTGDLDLELWEPHLGLADARGGVHVDFGVTADDPDAVANEVADDALSRTDLDEGVRVRDPDGHYVTLANES